MFKWNDNFFRPYLVSSPDTSLLGKIVALEEKIKKLEKENVELTNCLYEVENRLNAKIDNIHPVTYTLHNYGLDK